MLNTYHQKSRSPRRRKIAIKPVAIWHSKTKSVSTLFSQPILVPPVNLVKTCEFKFFTKKTISTVAINIEIYKNLVEVLNGKQSTR
jgi:hypothetical protein